MSNESQHTAHASEPVIHLEEHERAADTKTIFGFWVYLMTDFVLFASLFAVFIVLRSNGMAAGVGAALFDMRLVLAETLILLVSSLTCGLFLLAARAGHVRQVLAWMCVTVLLGAAFVGIELIEFNTLMHEGYGPGASGFMSAFFTLVGTHGLHVSAGILWMLILAWKLMQSGLTRAHMRKLMMLGMFWHFLDVIWIFIFTIVYLMHIV